MAKLPLNQKEIPYQIWQAYQDKQPDSRPYLGMSQIGEACIRRLWYDFRHVTQKHWDGRMLALFERGHNEEAQVCKKLRMIGIQVVDFDENGDQFEFVGHKGHEKGHMDAALLGVPQAPKTWHVGEIKTHNDKSFMDVAKNGVQKSKPVHWAQMQMYMGHSGMERALYIAINKNDDSIYTERVYFDKSTFDDLCAKAAYIIDAQEPPERLSNDLGARECQWCDFRAVCYEGSIPQANCRTCARSVPVDGGMWSCTKHGQAGNVCGDHLYIYALLGTPTYNAGDYVTYDRFINATVTAAEGNAFEGWIVRTSKQLEAAGYSPVAADAGYAALREALAS